MKRFTIALEGKAAEIMSRIPRSVRGLVMKRLIEEAEEMGYFRCVLLDEEEIEKKKKPKKKVSKGSINAEEIIERAKEEKKRQEREQEQKRKEKGEFIAIEEETERENNGSAIGAKRDPEWLQEIRERIKKKVNI